jgi:hypothetical protein
VGLFWDQTRRLVETEIPIRTGIPVVDEPNEEFASQELSTAAIVVIGSLKIWSQRWFPSRPRDQRNP